MLLWQLLGFRDIQNKGVGKQEKAREHHIISLSSEVSIVGRHHLSLVHFDRSCSIFSGVLTHDLPSPKLFWRDSEKTSREKPTRHETF